MPYELPPLPYAHNALEPFIDEQTMQIHHGKHHQAYITNLNAALEKHPELQGKPIEQLIASLDAIPEDIRTAVRNNGGGHANHSLFWQIMKPGGGGEPTGAVAKAIADELGGFAAFKDAFSKAGATRFGSGWAWLVKDGDALKVTKTGNADLPLKHGQTALLTVDVWEHAYYIDYRNLRPKYVEVFLNNLVDWDFVAANLAAAE